MAYKIKNWDRFQHYKNRRPPWLKLYRDLLDDPDWNDLSGEAAKGLIMLWIIASDTLGVLPPLKKLSFRLRMTEKNTNTLLSTLSGWLERDASDTLAESYHDATPELEKSKRREREDTPLLPKRGLASFDQFWKAYPKKAGKGGAEKAWLKIPGYTPVETLLKAIDLQKRSEDWQKEGGKFIPYPATWLNQRRWEDELKPGRDNRPSTIFDKIMGRQDEPVRKEPQMGGLPDL